MRVAIVHYWLVSMRGGEKVIEELCGLFPEAVIFTHVYDPASVSETIRKHKIKTTFINSLPNARRWYKRYLPLMPLALEQLDLRNYDLIISSEAGPAKGIVPPPGAVHICYCHSPMRYIWNMAHDYLQRADVLTRILMPLLSHYVRSWDAVAAMRVDHFIANSYTVSARIEKYYRRKSVVIYPPVDIDMFEIAPVAELDEYYLMVGELVAYKRPELAVEACNALGRPLVVIGGGEMLSAIRNLAGPTVTVLGSQPLKVLKSHYARCRALIFPGEEDFGIVPVEAMACGRPVIAYGRGGATETVASGISGLFFQEQTAEAIQSAICDFEQMHFDSVAIREHARKFDRQRFVSELIAAIERALGDSFAREDDDEGPHVERQLTSTSSKASARLAPTESFADIKKPTICRWPSRRASKRVLKVIQGALAYLTRQQSVGSRSASCLFRPRPFPISYLFGLTVAALVALIAPEYSATAQASGSCELRPVMIENFDAESIAADRVGRARWTAHTPWSGDFGEARFADPGPAGPFKIKDGILAAADASGAGSGTHYGYFEARMKMPPGPGVWPAFWLAALKPAKTADGNIEIDVVEYYGQFGSAYQIPWGGG